MTDIAYLSLKQSWAEKVGPRARGRIGYRVLSDITRQEIYLVLVANEDKGWFSPEIIPFSRIETIVESHHGLNTPMLSRLFRSAFSSRSTNNAGFLAAVLRAEGLLTAVSSASNQHRVNGDWTLWRSMMNELSGEPYTYADFAELNTEIVPGKDDIADEQAVDSGTRRKSRKSTKSERNTAVEGLTGEQDENIA